ncbi:hypothetical protein D3C83_175950 [compost metagenome]
MLPGLSAKTPFGGVPLKVTFPVDALQVVGAIVTVGVVIPGVEANGTDKSADLQPVESVTL